MAILKSMESAGIEPTETTYETFISGYALQGDIKSIRQVC